MEGKYNNFLKRTFTIVIVIPLIIFMIFWEKFPFFIVILLLASFGLNELYSMARKRGFEPPFILGFILTSYFIFLSIYDYYNIKYDKDIFLIFIIIIAILYFITQMFKKDHIMLLPNISIGIFGSVYLGYLFSFILKIKYLPNGNYCLLSLLFITWVNDSAAYIIGTKFGKNRIFPQISPKKSIEGSIGGIIFSTISVFILKNWLSLTFTKLIFLCLVIAIMAQFGDLFESMLKRGSEVKDSGNLFPGHGGILDCLDSLLFTAPVFYYYITFLI